MESSAQHLDLVQMTLSYSYYSLIHKELYTVHRQTNSL